MHGHDRDRGTITDLCATMTQDLMLSAGTDGLVIVRALQVSKLLQEIQMARREPTTLLDYSKQENDSDAEEHQIEPLELRTLLEAIPLSTNDERLIPDITDPKAYSIRDAQLRAAEDSEMDRAENKKREIRKKVEALRKHYQEVLEANENEQEEPCKVSSADLLVDSDVLQKVEKEKKVLFDNAYLSVAREFETSIVRLMKLRDRYVSNLECEPPSVRPFSNGKGLRGFRMQSLPQETHAFLQKHLDDENDEALSSSLTASMTFPSLPLQREPSMDSDYHLNSDRGVSNSANHQSSYEVRKAMRYERKKELAAMVKREPNENAEDPRDLEEIEDAQNHMGDYKLKGNSNYQVFRIS